MQLKEFSLINPKLEASSVFQAMETVIQPKMIEAALKKTNSLESRKRKLTSSLVVCLGMRIKWLCRKNRKKVVKPHSEEEI